MNIESRCIFIKRHIGLDERDKSSHSLSMNTTGTKWPLIAKLAEKHGASKAARAKWRSRGVPYKWRLILLSAAAGQLTPSDFESQRRAA